jgi:hypothetical protein
MLSRWFLPAVVLTVCLCSTCVVAWPENVALTPLLALGVLVSSASLAFGLAVMFELSQWIRARFVRNDRVWSLLLLIAMVGFSGILGLELVRAMPRLATLGDEHVVALSLAVCCALALVAQRSRGFDFVGPSGRWLTLLSNVILLAILFWVQHVYSQLLRESRFASVSAGFLLLTGITGLRLVERLRADTHEPRGLPLLSGALALSVTAFVLTPEQPLRQLYFAGLYPGRILFALHLPELLVHRAARSAASARVQQAATSEQAGSAEPQVEREDTRAEVVVLLLVDALREDAFYRYVRDPQSRLHRAYRDSCLAGKLYAPSSNTTGSLTSLLLRPYEAEERWFEQVKQAGVQRSLLVDEKLATSLNRMLPVTVDATFDLVVRVPRQADDEVAPLSELVPPLVEAPGPQLIWTHFYDVHEWDHGDPSASPSEYHDRVAQVGAQVADLLQLISRSERKVSVILTADHGEGLDHFSTRHHGEYVYEPLVRVPLMLWTHGHNCPERTAAVLADKVPSANILGRLTLDELGIAAAAQTPTLAELAAKPAVIQASVQDAIIRWPHKLIVSPWFTQLFDLETDPNELHDLSPSRRPLARELRDLLENETSTL